MITSTVFIAVHQEGCGPEVYGTDERVFTNEAQANLQVTIWKLEVEAQAEEDGYHQGEHGYYVREEPVHTLAELPHVPKNRHELSEIADDKRRQHPNASEDEISAFVLVHQVNARESSERIMLKAAKAVQA